MTALATAMLIVVPGAVAVATAPAIRYRVLVAIVSSLAAWGITFGLFHEGLSLHRFDLFSVDAVLVAALIAALAVHLLRAPLERPRRRRLFG